MNRKKRELMELILMGVSAAVVIMTIFTILLENKTFRISETFIIIASAFFCIIVCTYMIMFLRRISPKKNIFVSYTIKDCEEAKKYSDILLNLLVRSKRYRFELIDAEKAVSYGENIKDSITNTIEKSDIVLVYISNAYCSSSFANEELQIAEESKRVLIPILLEKVENIEKFPKNLLDVKSVKLYKNLSEQQKKQNILDLSEDLLKNRFI